MELSRFFWAALYGLVAGFVTYLLLWALGLPPQPWSMVVGILVFLAYLFSGFFPARRL